MIYLLKATDRTNLVSYGHDLLNVTEKLLSKLVWETDTYSNISFSVQNLEVQVFMVGPHANLNTTPTLVTSHVSMDIDLVGLSIENNGSAAVAFMTYINMESIFNPNFTVTLTESKKTLMSAMVSCSLVNVRNKKTIKPVNFTIKHIRELGPGSVLSCMDWTVQKMPSCYITKSNRTHTVCTCKDIINFALVKIQIFAFVLNVTMNKIPTFITSHAALDIDLIGISIENKESAAVTIIIYTNMSDILQPIFNTFIQTNKTMMSAVVSVSLSEITSKHLNRPINITLKHTSALEPESSLSCVYWKDTEWVEHGCDIIQTNSSHTVCSCNHLATFALIMETDPCRVNLTELCIMNFLNEVQDNTTQELTKEVVERYLNIIIKLMNRAKSNTTENNLMYYGNAAMDLNKKLVSKLVKKTETYNASISVQNLEVGVLIVVDSDAFFISQLSTNDATLEIDLIGLSKNNKGSAGVAFMSYTNVKDILKPKFFNTDANTVKTMMSTVVSATLLKTANTYLSKPVTFTFKHIGWEKDKWVKDFCVVTKTNSTHTVCSCDNLSVFALIMELIPCKTLFGSIVSLQCWDVLNKTVFRGIEVFFLTLCLLTFAFFCQNPKDTNTALINLCLNLLLFHLTDLLKPLYQIHLQPPQACAVMAGIRWFFFISAFVWMFIETVLIFLLVKNLSKIRSNQREVLSMKWINMIGYLVPVAVVIVCELVSPQKSVNEKCWENYNSLKSLSFDIPILFIVTSNMILYIFIIIMMIFTLKRLKNENLQRNNTDDKALIIRVMIKSLAQFVVLGCYWIFVYIPRNDGILNNIFLFLNYQQGTFIFLVHCLLNHEVRQQYRKFVCVCFCFKKLDTTTEVEETHQ
ncbi:adhesion G protein-coupled receptor E3-like [Tachysurus vachellii]|uniref:adhesion G protein-coupled receptor E3-like n=1 Tax=Tachysurus vachellii TaxID=175792 RepID=UPI00296B4BAB|nr:adhesion G protein-coupled receptor E3-like [Tachysurus vachellii]